MSHPISVTRRERGLFCFGVSLLLLALFGPIWQQPADYHHFADQRAWGSLPHALDVLSNLPFALMAGLGWRALAHKGRQAGPRAGLLRLFFGGLLSTALLSSYYHLQPTDAALAWDRLGMVPAFAGLLGLCCAERISARAGTVVAGSVLLAGVLAVAWSVGAANVLPWALLQGGGMLCVLVGACLPGPVQPGRVNWWAVIACYALAKGLELADQPVFELIGVSGHSLKHLCAALAAWPVLRALYTSGRRQAAHAQCTHGAGSGEGLAR